MYRIDEFASSLSPADLSEQQLSDEILDWPHGDFHFTRFEDLLEEARERLQHDTTQYGIENSQLIDILKENRFSSKKIEWIREICDRLILMPGAR